MWKRAFHLPSRFGPNAALWPLGSQGKAKPCRYLLPGLWIVALYWRWDICIVIATDHARDCCRCLYSLIIVDLEECLIIKPQLLAIFSLSSTSETAFNLLLIS